jgi:hypothetical protein
MSRERIVNPTMEQGLYKVWLDKVTDRFKKYLENISAANAQEGEKSLRSFMIQVFGQEVVPLSTTELPSGVEQKFLFNYIAEDLRANSAQTFVHHDTSDPALRRKADFYFRAEVKHDKKSGGVLLLRPVVFADHQKREKDLYPHGVYAGIILKFKYAAYPFRSKYIVVGQSQRYTFETIFDELTKK